MPRPAGTRNPEYQQRRAALIAKLERRLVDPPNRPNMLELARSAEVSIPTLKHYFGDRAGVVAAVLVDGRARGDRFMAIAAEPSGPFPQSIADLVSFVVQGFTRGRLGDLLAVGFAEAFRDAAASAAYLDNIMDPMIAAAGARLATHVERGEMIDVDTRHAALGLIGPLFLALVHQFDFAGKAHHPIDLEAFGAQHGAAFIRAYRT